MQNTIQQYLANISASRDKEVLQILMQYVARQVNTVALRSAGLEIAAGGSALAQIGASSTYVATVGGRYVSIAAGTDMPALTGLSITASAFNVACFFVNAAGTVVARFGIEGATAARVKFPDFPVDMALVGFLLITHGSAFNVACFFVNAAGTVVARFGTEGATAARVRFPDFPVDMALVGFLLITHSSAFTGGTTALDTATTVYVSPVGAFDPTFLYT